MSRVDQLGALNRFGKRLAPALARIAARPRGARTLALLEAYLAVLQGKGSGSGWDLRAETAVAARQIHRKQPVILDIGANRGAWSADLYRKISFLDPTFYLAEPAQACQPALAQLQLGAHSHILSVAIGAEEGKAMLFSDVPGSEAASLHLRRDSYHQSDAPTLGQPTRVTTIDRLAAEYGLTEIDYLKIDVEGNELDVLQGADRCLAAASIRALAFEFGSGQINSRTWFHDFWDLLTPRGYHMHRILPGGRLLAVTEYYESLEYFRGVSNYLALRYDQLPR